MRRVSEFAKAKGISRGRAYELARNGTLPTQKLQDGTILLEESAMLWQPRPARPLSRRMAWALLSTLEDEAPRDLRDAERSRMRKHLEEIAASENPAQTLSAKVSARSVLRRYRASDEDLTDLRRDPRLHISGVGASESHMTAGNQLEAYVLEVDLQSLVDAYLLDEDRSGNVRLRIGAPAQLGRASIAADLADWGGIRELREANRIVSTLLNEKR